MADRAVIERDQNGKALRITGAMSDISELKLYQEQLEATNRALNESKDEALKAARIKSEFLSNMSHEIRTPLNAIVGMADVLAETNLEPEQRRSTELLKKASRTLLNLVNDILDFSKLEGKQVLPLKSSFDLHELLDRMLGLFSALALEKKIRMDLTIGKDVPKRVVGDEKRVEQVLTNIVGNALKFTSHGSISIHVKRNTDNHIVFNVRDTGIGIAPNQLPLLFQRFTQADSGITKRFGGTGLGLAISKQLVDLMNGEIWAESTLNEGTTFTFVLPLDEAHEESGLENGHAKIASTEILYNSEAPVSILVVDDSSDNRNVIGAYLRKTRCRLEMAENGQDAIEKLMTGHYDLILMDMQMPVEDGYSATREIRQWESDHGGHRIPIIALSAHAMEEEKKRSLDAGCNAHLSKPVTKSELLSALSAHLN